MVEQNEFLIDAWNISETNKNQFVMCLKFDSDF